MYCAINMVVLMHLRFVGMKYFYLLICSKQKLLKHSLEIKSKKI